MWWRIVRIKIPTLRRSAGWSSRTAVNAWPLCASILRIRRRSRSVALKCAPPEHVLTMTRAISALRLSGLNFRGGKAANFHGRLIGNMGCNLCPLERVCSAGRDNKGIILWSRLSPVWDGSPHCAHRQRRAKELGLIVRACSPSRRRTVRSRLSMDYAQPKFADSDLTCEPEWSAIDPGLGVEQGAWGHSHLCGAFLSPAPAARGQN